jgi:hypothetical protein
MTRILQLYKVTICNTWCTDLHITWLIRKLTKSSNTIKTKLRMINSNRNINVKKPIERWDLTLISISIKIILKTLITIGKTISWVKTMTNILTKYKPNLNNNSNIMFPWINLMAMLQALLIKSLLLRFTLEINTLKTPYTKVTITQLLIPTTLLSSNTSNKTKWLPLVNLIHNSSKNSSTNSAISNSSCHRCMEDIAINNSSTMLNSNRNLIIEDDY